MWHRICRSFLYMQTVLLAGLWAVPAHAQYVVNRRTGHDFSSISRNINESIEAIPDLITSVTYILGTMLGVLGVMKIKDYVENPVQTPMKDGAVRIGAGGALFALPVLFEVMLSSIGTTSHLIGVPEIPAVHFNVR